MLQSATPITSSPLPLHLALQTQRPLTLSDPSSTSI